LKSSIHSASQPGAGLQTIIPSSALHDSEASLVTPSHAQVATAGQRFETRLDRALLPQDQAGSEKPDPASHGKFRAGFKTVGDRPDFGGAKWDCPLSETVLKPALVEQNFRPAATLSYVVARLATIAIF
jgi:hypothetical protein